MSPCSADIAGCLFVIAGGEPLVHRLYQSIPQLIRIPDVPHEGILDLLYSNAANLAYHKNPARIHGNGIPEEVTAVHIGLLRPGKFLRHIPARR